MSVRLSDIFRGDYYDAIDPVNSPEKTAVYESGIISHQKQLDDVAKLGQGTATINYWQDLDADEEPNITTDDPDQVGQVGKASQNSMKTRVLYLNKGYGVTDLASELANSDPMTHIRNRFGKYWTRRWQRYLIGASKGIIESNIKNNGGDMVITAGKIIKSTDLINAAYTAGDAAGDFSAMGVHSVVMKQLVEQDLIEYIKDSEGRTILALYLGKPIFMDDSLVYNGSQYLSLFYGSGAFGYGIGEPKSPVELERKPSGGNGGGTEILWERKTYILQPAGFDWKGDEHPDKSPLAVDFANGDNWKRVFDRKQVPFAAVISGEAPKQEKQPKKTESAETPKSQNP